MNIDFASCVELISCPMPDNLPEYLSYPRFVFQGGDVARWLSSFSPLQKTIPYCANKFAVANELIRSSAASNWVFLSWPDQIAGFGVRGGIFRLTELVSHSIYHQICQRRLSGGQHFFFASITLLLPHVVMYLIGYSSQEVLLLTMVKISASYLLKPKLANLMKQLDLIVTQRQFSAINFIQQNLYTAIVHLATTIIVVDVLRSYLLWGEHTIRGIYVDPLDLALKTMNDTTTSISVCGVLENRHHFNLIAHMPRFFSDYFMTEGGWILGKMLVDGVFILSAWNGSVEDLRDPLAHLWPAPPQRFNKLRIRSQPNVNQHTIAIKKKPNTPTPIAQSQSLANPDKAAFQIHGLVPSTKREKIKKGSIKPSETLPPETPRPSTQALVQYAAPEKIVLFDPYRNITQTLIPLSGAGINNVAGSTWGIISCDETKKCPLGQFNTALNTGHVGQQGAIKSLGKSRINQKLLYELRPASTGARIIGTLAEGEDEIYQSLIKDFHYEAILPILSTMRKTDSRINLIHFNLLFSSHEKAGKYLNEHLL